MLQVIEFIQNYFLFSVYTVPFLLRDVINYFDGKLPSGISFLGLSTPSEAVLSTGVALIIAYGAARAGTSFFNEV